MVNVIFKKASYDYKLLKTVLFDIIDGLGGNFIHNGARVLIKPNLLLPACPEKAIITHPLVVKAIAEYVLEKGGHVQISDSPALGAFSKILEEGKYKAVFNGLDVVFKEFKESVKVDIGEPFGKIDIAGDALEADLVINVAKLKTHAQMLLTLGVKNIFGCIIGFSKPEWHLRAGVDREIFAKLLVRIYEAVKPSLTILDGILAMEGDGPGKSGTPRETGVIAGSRSALALDSAVCSMLGLERDKLPTNRVARRLGLITQEIYVSGDFNMINNFRFPEAADLTFGPRFLQGFIRKYLSQRPIINKKLCRLCGECRDYCPVRAITINETKLVFDYDACIRCYCCIEVCPYGALRAKEALPGRLMRRIMDNR
jgi:uncharacterized protein (DUF362 family)/Pyruvate/2-oxoacid:ferredoxin oxidoreductase delta subunit